MTRCQLFSNNAIDGEECDVPKHFVIINHIISWPWRDKVKMVFYCCNVDGWFGHFGQEDWREAVLYHLYSVDIPRRMLAAFHESGSANTEVQQCHVAGITVSPSSTGGVSAKFEVPFEGVNIQFKRTTVVDPIGAIMGERPTVFDMQNQTLFALALGRVIVINTDIFRLVTKIQSDDDGAMSVIFLQFQLLGVPLESTEQRKAVALLTDTGCVKFADAVLAPATVQIVPMEFWEPWMN
eukprot:CAMPEP_0181318754 /NCGR_PEP_ID=MMETSP1101-20121128/17181_1 /TAXON_ID=46948 /ORGANISM="Rhodomonas abbreviata, Strain Caron Lab Isolate" /LENGTH=237 /DNA_ID=CAMNT_0023426257 /DNA_START=187 /DNA_END=898 /DNA_ORIENTATION=+